MAKTPNQDEAPIITIIAPTSNADAKMIHLLVNGKRLACEAVFHSEADARAHAEKHSIAYTEVFSITPEDFLTQAIKKGPRTMVARIIRLLLS